MTNQWKITTAALVGWAGIVALAWWLAERRVALCGDWWNSDNAPCIIRTSATRDAVLIGGFTVALVALVAAALAFGIPTLRLNRQPRPSTTKAPRQPLLP